MADEIFFNNRLVYGPGSLDRLGALCSGLGTKALLVTGRNSLRGSGVLDSIFALLDKASVDCAHFSDVEANPSVSTVDRCAETGRRFGADLVIAVGGGSAMDTAKAASAMMTNPGSVEEYLEAGPGPRPLSSAPARVVAIPTTAGTGTEATQNAVINIPRRGLKVSLRSPMLVPALAILDPSLIASCPDDVAAAAGMDALTQLIEPLTGKKSQPMIDSLCVDGIVRISRSLERFMKDRGDTEAATDLQLAAYDSGLALANAGLGAVHALARPFGGMFGLPHGLACAVLLPHVTALNWRANVRKYALAGRALGADTSMTEEQAAGFCADRIARLNAALGLPRDFKKFRICRDQIVRIVEDSQGSSLKNNPEDLDRARLTTLLEGLL
jgi:alcohol dehydrogenase class IV